MKLQRRSRSKNIRRSLRMESLEERQLLTTILDFAQIAARGFQVPENGANERIHFQNWSDNELVSFTQPSHGTLELNPDSNQLLHIWPDGQETATYTPDADFTGVDSFEFTAVNGNGDEYTDTIWLNVTQASVAIPDWMRVKPASADNELDVLRNDYRMRQYDPTPSSTEPYLVSYYSDIELEIVDVTADVGQALISEDGLSLLYQTDGDYRGLDTLTYTIEDELGNRSSAEVTVDVTAEVDTNHFSSETEFNHALISSAIQQHTHQFGSFGHPWATQFCDVFAARGLFIDDVFFSAAGESFDTTNVQVDGVDEGDIVETDGDYLYVAAGNKLSVLDVRDASNPAVISSVEFDESIVDMYLHEDRLTIISGDAASCYVSHTDDANQDAFTLHLLDVESPDTPTRVSTTTIDGRYEDSRVTDSTLYLISQSRLEATEPQTFQVGTAGEEVSFYETVDQYIDRLTDSIRLPTITAESGETSTTALFAWNDVLRTEVDNHELFTTITTFDLGAADGVAVDVDTFTGNVSEVYVSTEAIYLFSQTRNLDFGDATFVTGVKKFDFVDEGLGVDYAATGMFDGTLQNQFSADEHDGFLRIAASEGVGVSNIYVMQQSGEELNTVASLEDIAPGESIYASRFEGDRGFVTTFRRIDPFFVIDLSDPLNPQVDGELKIPGFSNHLKVIDDDHVIGIGQSEGWGGETEISLFNVADPENPVRLTTFSLGDGHVEAPFGWRGLEGDQLAMNYVEEEGILAIPVHRFDNSLEAEISAIMVLQIDTQAGTITELGEVEFEGRATRSVHINGHLFSISPTTIKVTPLTTPDDVVATVDLNVDSGNSSIGSMGFDGKRATDLNGDGQTSGIDLAMINNALIRQGMGEVPTTTEELTHMNKMDIDDNGHFAGTDVVMVLNKVIRNSEGSRSPAPVAAPLSAGVSIDSELPTESDDGTENPISTGGVQTPAMVPTATSAADTRIDEGDASEPLAADLVDRARVDTTPSLATAIESTGDPTISRLRFAISDVSDESMIDAIFAGGMDW